MMEVSKRKANLDLLRAIAILCVVIFHISQYVSLLTASQQKLFSIGAYGVDIFFILSGWLIGTIYFREYNNTKHINFLKFWGRRWLRTLPPYYVALLVSWLAVYFSRKQSFDYKYLIFLQNYESVLPFFLVSWSLCIEEHFYLFMPLILFSGLRFNIVIYICIFFICLSSGLRVYNYVGSYPPFGYILTATHLRLDGLILGILASYVHTIKKPYWPTFSKSVKIIGPLAGSIAIILYLTDHPMMYSAGLFLLPLLFLSLLCYCIDSREFKLSKMKIISPIALSSYSIYLTNALSINFVNIIVKDRGFLYIIIVSIIIFFVGYVFYLLVELPSIRVREKIVPSSNKISHKVDIL